MDDERGKAYYRMLNTFLEHEMAYWAWAKQIEQFNKRCDEFYYQLRYPSNKKKRIKAALDDYPMATIRDIKKATSLCFPTILRNTKELKRIDEPYWHESSDKYSILGALKSRPDDIYDAIEETYEWSKHIHIRTTLIERYLPDLIVDIANGQVDSEK